MSTAILLAGCAKAAPQPQTSTLPEIDTAATGAQQLESRLMSQTDLPDGFEETQLPSVQGGLGSLIGCPALEPPAPSDTEARVSFAIVSKGDLISETVRMAGPDQSHQVLADLAKVPQQCHIATATTAPELGTESTALELNATLTPTGTVVNGYLVGMRDDKTLVVVVYVTPGKADRATADSVTKVAWEKATRPAQ